MNRPFTYLPNPVIFPLNKQAFSLRRLLAEYSDRLKTELYSTTTYTHPEELRNITAKAVKLNHDLPQHQDGDFSPPHLDDLHSAIDLVDQSVLSDERNAKEVVLDVLRRHIQEVLLAINTSLDSEPGGNHSPVTKTQQQLSDVIRGEISFDDLLKVPHEKREASLMEKYFEEICLRVVSTSSHHHDPQAVAASRFIHGQELSTDTGSGLGLGALREGDGMHLDDGVSSMSPDMSALTPALATGTPRVTEDAGWGLRRLNTTSSVPSRSETWRKSPPTPAEVHRHTIWCALMFRMICWLLLHDFDKKDKQLPKSELMGSRLPVFII